MSGNLTKLFPANEFPEEIRDCVFQHIFRRLAAYRNTSALYMELEASLSSFADARQVQKIQNFKQVLNSWAQALLEHAWVVCDAPGGGKFPELDEYADTSLGDLEKLPSLEDLSRIMNTILLLQITSSKEYSSRTRTFLSSFGPLDEQTIVATLKHPDDVLKEAQKRAEETKKDHADKGKVLRIVGMSLGAIAGGVLVGVTGGLAAPLVGGAVATIFGWIGIGGTAAGLIATGLASSSVVCGALFGAYGANYSASMVRRHMKEVRDLAIVPVGQRRGEETLAIRLCVSGWLSTEEDVFAPWTVFEGSDTIALQWEVQALKDLSNALYSLSKSAAMKYIRAEIISRTLLASLMTALAPTTLLNIGQIVDNPWMNAKALAIKAGAVLGDLLAKRAFGNRPMTLTGYSLGSLVIFEALKHLATLPPSETLGLVQDVFLFGTPASGKPASWAAVRRVVAGRLVNGYASNDYVLAVLSRASDVSWKVAGLHPVDVMGVENVLCEGIEGHTEWRGMIGKALQQVGASDLNMGQVDLQVKTVADPMHEDLEMSKEEAEELLQKGRSNAL